MTTHRTSTGGPVPTVRPAAGTAMREGVAPRVRLLVAGDGDGASHSRLAQHRR